MLQNDGARQIGYLDVIVDVWQLQGKAAAEVPLCAPAGIAGRQLRSVCLHDMQPSSAVHIQSAVSASAIQTAHTPILGFHMQQAHPCVLPVEINDR